MEAINNARVSDGTGTRTHPSFTGIRCCETSINLLFSVVVVNGIRWVFAINLGGYLQTGPVVAESGSQAQNVLVL